MVVHSLPENHLPAVVASRAIIQSLLFCLAVSLVAVCLPLCVSVEIKSAVYLLHEDLLRDFVSGHNPLLPSSSPSCSVPLFCLRN